MLKIILVVSLVGVLYTYAGYPFLIAIWSALGGRGVIRRRITPRISIVIAAWNEASRLPARIENCLTQEYPAELLEVIVVSDGSSDGTDAIVRQFDERRVRFIVLDGREGKAVALNSGVAGAQGEVIVFTDARQRFDPTAIAELVANFADQRVGAVSGELMLESNATGCSPEAVGLYWKLEKWIRRMEGSIDSIVGSTGAIHAIRRNLFTPLPTGAILDDLLIPMQIAMRGYRVVFEPRARAYDCLTGTYKEEFARKVRTLAGNYQAISLCPDLVKPWRNRLWFQFVSHKVTRLAAPFFLVALLVCNMMDTRGWLAYLLAAQLVGYAAALVGWGLQRVGLRDRITSAAFAFCLLNYAALVGAIRFASRDSSLWRKSA